VRKHDGLLKITANYQNYMTIVVANYMRSRLRTNEIKLGQGYRVKGQGGLEVSPYLLLT